MREPAREESCPVDDAFARASVLMTMSMVRFRAPVKGAPSSTSWFTQRPFSALDNPYLMASFHGHLCSTLRSVRTCIRDAAQVSMSAPLKYALSGAVNGRRVRHDVGTTGHPSRGHGTREWTS